MPTSVTDEVPAGDRSVTDRTRSFDLALRVLSKTDLSDFESEVRVAQVVSLARETPIHAIGNLGNGIVFVAAFWNTTPHWLAALWLLLFSAFAGVQLHRWHRKRSWPRPRQVSRRAVISTTIWSRAAGLLWSAAVIYIFPAGDISYQVLVVLLVGGLAAGAVASMAIQPAACLAFFMPVAAPIPFLLAAQGGPIDNAIAAMFVLYILVLIVALTNGISSNVAMIRSKIEIRTLTSGLAESRETSRAKSQFLATMSHELRTPLNAIIGFSQLIKDETFGPVGNADYVDYASDIYGSGQQLLTIIGDVLDMSNLDMNKLELELQPLDVNALTQDAVQLIRKAAFDKNVKLAVDLPPCIPQLLCDGQRVKQIIFNLLSNAVKFNRPDGAVRLSVTQTDEGLVIRVADDGIGMSADKIATAMQPFTQLGDAFARNYEGIGLGLPLAQALIRLHGGRFSLASEPGVGTTATVIFPPELLTSPQLAPRAVAA